MKHQIFELNPTIKIEPDGYYNKTIVNFTLEQDSEYPDTYDSQGEAYDYIKSNPGIFKRKKLVIMPVIVTDYKGVVEE